MARPFDPPLDPGEVGPQFEVYRDLEVLAVGGQACVFHAEARNGTSVAIKVYSPNAQLVRAQREVQKLKMLDSPYVVRLLDAGEVTIRGQQSFFSVTPFEKGLDLRRYLAKFGPLNEEAVRQLLHDIGLAIDGLWAIRVVHCDIKPENILVCEDGSYRLIDLGIAKHLDAETITLTGMVLGTNGYLAPEQLRGRKNFTSRVDVFAAGIVAFEALTGIHPWRHNQFAIHVGLPAMKPSDFVGLSEELERTILRMIRLDPIRRPSSGSQIVKMLGESK